MTFLKNKTSTPLEPGTKVISGNFSYNFFLSKNTVNLNKTPSINSL
jgi:hypothetical protein